jgi:nitrite reductase (NADH) small subunit
MTNPNKMKIKLATKSQIPVGKAIIVREGGTEIALFNIDGQIYALENVCPHMGGPLGEGDIDQCTVTCPWHGWQFDVRSGECENMPGENAKRFEIAVEGDDIYLINS